MIDSTDPIPLKQCSQRDQCINPKGSLLPATTEYFHKDNTASCGLRPRCKVCECAHKRRLRAANPEREKELWLQRKAREGDSRKPYFKALYHANRETRIQRTKDWSAANPDKVRLNSKLKHQRRRSRQANVPDTLTHQQWADCLDYWTHRCCICGRPAGLWHTLAKEHWIPLSDPRPDNPGTVAANILPMCHGLDGCNNSKADSDPLEWLFARLGSKAAALKQREIEAYFSWARQQNTPQN